MRTVVHSLLFLQSRNFLLFLSLAPHRNSQEVSSIMVTAFADEVQICKESRELTMFFLWGRRCGRVGNATATH